MSVPVQTGFNANKPIFFVPPVVVTVNIAGLEHVFINSLPSTAIVYVPFARFIDISPLSSETEVKAPLFIENLTFSNNFSPTSNLQLLFAS